jgi:hypothetical protein
MEGWGGETQEVASPHPTPQKEEKQVIKIISLIEAAFADAIFRQRCFLSHQGDQIC